MKEENVTTQKIVVETEETKEVIETEEIIETVEPEKKEEIEPSVEAARDWRDSVYGNIKMSVRTLDVVIGIMVGIILLILISGAVKAFL